jgi:hypothetical protein
VGKLQEVGEDAGVHFEICDIGEFSKEGSVGWCCAMELKSGEGCERSEDIPSGGPTMALCCDLERSEVCQGGEGRQELFQRQVCQSCQLCTCPRKGLLYFV